MRRTLTATVPLGRNIRTIRETQGFTLSDLANKAKMSQSYLSEIERGEVENPTLEMTLRLAEALGVTIEDLIAAKQEEPLMTTVASRPLFYDKKALKTKGTDASLIMQLLVATLEDRHVKDEYKLEMQKEIQLFIEWMNVKYSTLSNPNKPQKELKGYRGKKSEETERR